MRTISIYSFLMLIAILLISISSCEPTTNIGLEESFRYVKTTTPIEAAQNTDINIQTNNQSDSFFMVTLADGSLRKGWCIEWNDEYIEGDQKGVNFYSTKGHSQWSVLNYFMGIKDQLQAEDPDLTFREIQVIIWSLLDNPAFDVDKIAEYDNIPSNIYSNGQAHFNIEKVKTIVNQVNNNSSLAKSTLSERGVTIIENDGQTIMVEDETAFAVKTTTSNGEKTVDANYSTCFDEEIIENVSFNNWGWTNGPIAEDSGEPTFDIYAGAGQCDLNKGTLVGKLTVNYSNGSLTVTYTMTETSAFDDALYTLLETHLYVGSSPYPTLANSNYTVAPGQYGYQQTHDDITEYTYEIDGLSGDIYFIAHAVVNGFPSDDEE